MTHDPRLVLADHAPRIPGVGRAVSLRAVLHVGRRAMTTYRTTWIPPDHFAPDHRDFRYQAPADHYAEIQRQLGARDVGVTELAGTGAAGAGLRGAETGLGATNGGARDYPGIRDSERGAQSAANGRTA